MSGSSGPGSATDGPYLGPSEPHEVRESHKTRAGLPIRLARSACVQARKGRKGCVHLLRGGGTGTRVIRDMTPAVIYSGVTAEDTREESPNAVRDRAPRL